MKKVVFIVIAVLVIPFVLTVQEYAYGAQPHSGGGGYYGGGGHYGGGGYYRGAPYYGHGYNYWRGPYYGAGIWFWPGWGGWGPWWWGYPGYPYYSTPPVVIQEQPHVYMEPTPQPEEQSYWYYCPNPQGYYPYVKQCPKGWMKVVPQPVEPDAGQ